MFSHGGVCGLRDGAKRLPRTTQYLTRFAKDVAGVQQFGAVGIVKNSSLGCHRDLHNQPGSFNAVYPLNDFSGGILWIQGDPEEEEEVCRKQVKPGLWKDGVVKEFGEPRTIYFAPRQWHEVQPHDGDRYVLVAYSPRCSNLRDRDGQTLRDLGFAVMETQPKEGAHVGLLRKDAQETVEKAATVLNKQTSS